MVDGFLGIPQPWLYPGWLQFTAVLPKLYWGVDSQEQRILRICKALEVICAKISTEDATVSDLQKQVDVLQADFEQFKTSGFADYYEQQISQWVADNMASIMEQATRQVYFGLTQEGYFAAYIPSSWDAITFDTGAVYSLDTYGRLILRMDTDSPSTVDQTPETVERPS